MPMFCYIAQLYIGCLGMTLCIYSHWHPYSCTVLQTLNWPGIFLVYESMQLMQFFKKAAALCKLEST